MTSVAQFTLGRGPPSEFDTASVEQTEIIREAEKFDWAIQEGSLRNAVDFLEKLGMVQTAEKAS